MPKHIPIHQLSDRSGAGWEVRHFRRDEMRPGKDILEAHRDDHYLFFLLEEGKASMAVDFEQIEFNSSACVFYVLPGQVHYRLRGEVAEGWFVAVDTGRVKKSFRSVFENQFLLQSPFYLSAEQLGDCREILELLYKKQQGTDAVFGADVARSLMDGFLGLVAGYYHSSGQRAVYQGRPGQLSAAFRALLATSWKECKSPSAYAAMLNISESYLNETVRKVTGFSVSYWITHEVMMEAKRLLYYSELNVKEIAVTLGYEDHTYFSKIFRKEETMTPLAFRGKYRE